MKYLFFVSRRIIFFSITTLGLSNIHNEKILDYFAFKYNMKKIKSNKFF